MNNYIATLQIGVDRCGLLMQHAWLRIRTRCGSAWLADWDELLFGPGSQLFDVHAPGYRQRDDGANHSQD